MYLLPQFQALNGQNMVLAGHRCLFLLGIGLVNPAHVPKFILAKGALLV